MGSILDPRRSLGSGGTLETRRDSPLSHPGFCPADGVHLTVPPSFPKGAMIAVLAGNPFKEGPYVVRLKMPANYQLPAHHHPTTENVTVISGSFHAGMGDKLDEHKGQSFAPGGFVSMPAGMNHYAWATAETVVQVHGDGPFAIVYVNPADAPSKTN